MLGGQVAAEHVEDLRGEQVRVRTRLRVWVRVRVRVRARVGVKG